MTEPKKLLESSDSALARRLLSSGIVERPTAHSLERTMLTLGRQSGVVASEARSAHYRASSRRWGMLVLAFVSFSLGSVLSYLW